MREGEAQSGAGLRLCELTDTCVFKGSEPQAGALRDEGQLLSYRKGG